MFLGQIIVLSRLNWLFSRETSARAPVIRSSDTGIYILQRLAFGSVRDSAIVPKGWLSVLLGVYEASLGGLWLGLTSIQSSMPWDWLT